MFMRILSWVGSCFVSRAIASSLGKSRRKPVNLSLPNHIVEEAKSCGRNLSKAAEDGIQKALDERLKVEYEKHFTHWNADMAKRGLPLEEDILF